MDCARLGNHRPFGGLSKYASHAAVCEASTLARRGRLTVGVDAMLTAARRTLKSGKSALVLRPGVKSVSVAAEAADIKARILEEIQKPDTPPVVVIDLSELQYSGTYFFAILLGIRKRLAAHSQSLRLCSVAPEVDQSLRLCMLHRIIPICASVDEAIQA